MEIVLQNGRKIGDNHPAYIMAEIGINHNGKIEIAKQLIDEAAKIGVDAVKFQKRSLNEMYKKEFLAMPYKKDNSFGETYGSHKEFLEFSDNQLIELKKYSEEKNLDFIVSGFDFSGFDFIEEKLNPIFHKIASPMVSHTPLLCHVAKYGKPMVLSTGMHDFDEVKEAVETILKYNKKLIVLQCTTSYPTNDEDVNLSVIKRYKDDFNVLAGYSSHDRGVVIPASSVCFGSCFIEKHFTLDRTMKGPDHVASVEPRGLELILSYTRVIEAAIGNDMKDLNKVEYSAKEKFGYSCVAKENISKGEIVSNDKIVFKQPGTGLKPSEVHKILDKKSNKNIITDQEITENDIE